MIVKNNRISLFQYGSYITCRICALSYIHTDSIHQKVALFMQLSEKNHHQHQLRKNSFSSNFSFFSNFFFCEIGSKFVSAGRGSDHLSTLHSLQSDKPELKDISCYLEERKRIPRIMISIEYIVYIGISGDTDDRSQEIMLTFNSV